MDTVTTDLNVHTSRSASIQLIGWWCLFDSGEVWEWGRAVMTNVYDKPNAVLFRTTETYLQQPANQ